jgi:glycosyltransferase involved in cell wall biosynthesis
MTLLRGLGEVSAARLHERLSASAPLQPRNLRILIVTDAWHPAVNGVIRTIECLTIELQRLGYQVLVIGPDRFRTAPLPTYPEVRLALRPAAKLRRLIEAFAPHAIHIATEGPLGLAARRYCLRGQIRFTTAFHTRFAEYLASRAPIPVSWSYEALRRFHAPAAAVLVATSTLAAVLRSYGFERLCLWTRGVDTSLFQPRAKSFLDAPRPIALYVGRVAVEKNLEAFLDLELPGSKYVVGDGPQLAALRRRYPVVRFVGYKHGEELARFYAAADVFVFPSRTDTFGLVILESLACGVPVAAYPVPGPIDVLGSNGPGCLHEDLGEAVRAALSIPAEACRRFALDFTWQNSARQFADIALPLRWRCRAPGEPGLAT